jgi:hypothetical protein
LEHIHAKCKYFNQSGRDKNGIKIDSKGLFISVDNEGLTDYTTGERNNQILPQDISYLEEIGSGNGGIV